MKILRIFIFLIFVFFFNNLAQTQVYHYLTGKLIPDAQAGDLILKSGTFMNYDADFGTLVVPENRQNKQSRLINLPVVIVKSLNKNPKEPVFLLNGGPGQSNLWNWWFPDCLLKNHDVVMVGYRGVDGSVSLDFPDFFDYLKDKDTLFLENNFRQVNKLLTSYLDTLKSNKIDFNGYNIDEVANDIEVVRKVLTYKKINLFSFSYGTMIAYVYSQKYADNINYSIMNCAQPVSYLHQNKNIINDRIDKLCNYWINDSACFAKSHNISNTINDVVNDIPKHYNDFKISPEKLHLMIFNSLYSSKGIAMLFNTFINAKNGDYSGLSYLSNNFNEQFLYKIKLGDCFLKINSLNNGKYLNLTEPNDSSIGNHLSNAENNFWKFLNRDDFEIDKVSKFNHEDNLKVKTLFISGDLDAVTPVENVQKYLLTHFINNKLVVLKNFSHDDIFIKQQKAYQNLIGKYYLSGIVDTTKYITTPFNFKVNNGYEDMAKKILK